MRNWHSSDCRYLPESHLAGNDRPQHAQTWLRRDGTVDEQIGRMAGAQTVFGEAEEPGWVSASHVDRLAKRRGTAPGGGGHGDLVGGPSAGQHLRYSGV